MVALFMNASFYLTAKLSASSSVGLMTHRLMVFYFNYLILFCFVFSNVYFVLFQAPPYKRSARESPGNVTSPLSVLATPLSGLAMGMSGSPNASSGVPFLPNLPMSSLRTNLPPELYVSALTGSSGMVPLIPGSKASPSSATISPTGKASLLPSAAPIAMTGGRSGRSHGSRGSGIPGHSGGRVKQLPTWMDAPDDLFFHSTQITK